MKRLHLQIKSAASKWGSREANLFYILPLALAWHMTVNFNILFLIQTWSKLLFLIYMSLLIRWSPKEITKHQALVSKILMFNKIKML